MRCDAGRRARVAALPLSIEFFPAGRLNRWKWKMNFVELIVFNMEHGLFWLDSVVNWL